MKATKAPNKPERFAKFRVVQSGEKSILCHATATKMKLLKVGIEVNSVLELTAQSGKEFPSIPGIELDQQKTRMLTSQQHTRKEP